MCFALRRLALFSLFVCSLGSMTCSLGSMTWACTEIASVMYGSGASRWVLMQPEKRHELLDPVVKPLLNGASAGTSWSLRPCPPLPVLTLPGAQPFVAPEGHHGLAAHRVLAVEGQRRSTPAVLPTAKGVTRRS